MAGRGPVSGGAPRSGEDERSEPFDGTWHPGGAHYPNFQTTWRMRVLLQVRASDYI